MGMQVAHCGIWEAAHPVTAEREEDANLEVFTEKLLCTKVLFWCWGDTVVHSESVFALTEFT